MPRFLARPLVAIALVATTFVLAAPPASACSCMEPVVEDSVEMASAVFIGHEIDRSDDGGGGFNPVTVTFEVEEALKGSVPETIQVRTGTGGGDCGVGPLDDQGSVGVLAYLGEGDEQLTISICGSIFEPAEVLAVFGDAPTDDGPATTDDTGTTAPGDDDPPFERTGEIASPPSDATEDDGVAPWILIAGAAALVVIAVGSFAAWRARRSPTDV